MTKKTFRNGPIAIFFDENSNEGQSNSPVSVQLLRAGKYSYWEPGDLEVTTDNLACMVQNFKNNVRQVDLAIDYSHESWKEAAGWIKDLHLNDIGTELWAKVEWTPKAEKLLKDKEYRYLSSEFCFDYVDNESNAHYGCTLYGAGLTNRPFVKDMEPVVDLNEKKIKEHRMTLEEKMKKLEERLTENEKASQEKEAEIKSLKEEKVNSEIARKLEEKKSIFNRLLSEGKVCEAQRAPYMSDDMVKFSELTQQIKLDTVGSSDVATPAKEKSATDLSADQAEDKILAFAQEKVKAGMPMGEAIKLSLKENPALAEKYREKFPF